LPQSAYFIQSYISGTDKIFKLIYTCFRAKFVFSQKLIVKSFDEVAISPKSGINSADKIGDLWALISV